MNVKAHIRATEDIQNNQTDGGALCDAACSASSFANSKWLSHWERMKKKEELGLKFEGDEFWVRAIEDHGLDKSTFPYDEMNDLLNNHKGTNLWLKRLQEIVHAIVGRTFYVDLRTSSGSNP